MAGIMPSVAARIVDNAFMARLGLSEEEMNDVSPNTKIGDIPTSAIQLQAIKDFIRSDGRDGLPSIGWKIKDAHLRDIKTDAKYGTLINRVSERAERIVSPQ